MNKLLNFFQISSSLGLRLELVQAAGGNASFKIDNAMWIKASGVQLYAMNHSKGVVKIDLDYVLSTLEDLSKFEDKPTRDILAKDFLSINSPNIRPSMETFMHAVLPNVVFHFHDRRIIRIMSQLEGGEFFNYLTANFDFCSLGYLEPGLELAIRISEIIKNRIVCPEIFLLRNHGIIIVGEDINKVISILARIDDYFIEKDFSTYIHCRLERKKFVRKVEKINTVCFANYKPLTPDMVIYIGCEIFHPLELDHINLGNVARSRSNVVFFSGDYYILGKSFSHACEIEDVMFEYTLLFENVSPLSLEDVLSICNLPLESNRK